MLTVLLIRGLTLPGAGIGIQFYLYPDLGRLADPQVSSSLTNKKIFLLKVYCISGRSNKIVLHTTPPNPSGSLVFCSPAGKVTQGASIPWFTAGESSFCWVHLLSMKAAETAGMRCKARTLLGLKTWALLGLSWRQSLNQAFSLKEFVQISRYFTISLLTVLSLSVHACHLASHYFQ